MIADRARVAASSELNPQRRWDPSAGDLDPGHLAGADAVVNLAGAGVGDRRLTTARKQIVLSSRTSATGLLSRTVAGMADLPRVLLQGSASGAFVSRGDQVVTERTGSGDTFLAGTVRAREDAARPAVLPVPGWALRAVVGDFAQEILGSTRTLPEVLDGSGFVHRHRTVDLAARAVLG